MTPYLLPLFIEQLNCLKKGHSDKLEFGDGRARYENADREHHDHLIDINSGKVIEFVDNEIEKLQELIALRLGYELRGHKWNSMVCLKKLNY